MSNIGLLGAGMTMAIAAIGSALGISIAGRAAIGAWKRNFMANKPASFTLVVFAGAPITQIFYGYILTTQSMLKSSRDPLFVLAVGIAAGIAIAMSAVAQGQAGASASDAMGETGKGFGLYIMVVGLCETVALFVMALAMTML